MAAASAIVVCATMPPFMAGWFESNTSSASPAAPTKFAAHTIAQLRSTSSVVILPSAQAMASRLLPVKSSAPAITTSSSPRQNTTPPSTRCAAKPRVASDTTRVK